MESKTKLYSLTLDEQEIDALCNDLLLCSEQPSVVGVEVLKLNGMEWVEPTEEVDDDEDVEELETDNTQPNPYTQ